jgi:hypothetical protein
MALLFPKKPLNTAINRIYAGNIYSRPALAPFYKGLRGFSLANQNIANAFQNSLRSFATSPFAVNNENYMDQIRSKYGYNDEELQKALGTVGTVVGAGIGLASGLGYVRNPVAQ